MPFDGNGNFTVDQPAFVPSTPISSSATNSNNNDFADGLSNCVTRDGQSPPTVALPLANDGVLYAADPDTGIHRTSANTQAIECGGTDVVSISATGVTITGTLSVTGAQPGIPGEIRMWFLPTAPPLWMFCDGSAVGAGTPLGIALLAAGFPLLAPDFRGRAPFGKDTTGTRITAAGGNINGNVLGNSQDRQSKTLAVSEMPAHAHPGSTVAITDPTHAHSFPGGETTIKAPGAQGAAGASGTVGGTGTLAAATGITATPTIVSQGGGAAWGLLPGLLIVNFIIFVGA